MLCSDLELSKGSYYTHRLGLGCHFISNSPLTNYFMFYLFILFFNAPRVISLVMFNAFHMLNNTTTTTKIATAKTKKNHQKNSDSISCHSNSFSPIQIEDTETFFFASRDISSTCTKRCQTPKHKPSQKNYSRKIVEKQNFARDGRHVDK